jgi:hypothetical protein
MPYGSYGPGGNSYEAPYHGPDTYPSYTSHRSGAGTGGTQWWCTPVSGTTAVPVGQTPPTSDYMGCSYHP